MTVTGVEMSFTAPDTTPAGSYTATFRNDGTVFHELAFKDPSGKIVARISTGPKTTATLAVKLSRGTYDLECHEPGHFEGGMHRTLTVT